MIQMSQKDTKKKVPHRGRRGRHTAKRNEMHERVGRTDRIGRPGGKNRPQRTEVEDPIRKNDIIRKVGFALAGIQAVISIVFLVALFRLNMFPGLFVAVIGFVLAACLGIILASQFFSKKNAISGKVLSVVISILLLIASYYLFRVNSAIGEISGGEYKLDNMVVAVMAEDSAEKIQDAKEYRFGVQYQMKGEQIKETVDAINEELGTEIEVVEYESLAEQAEALHNGEVEAIIYNEGYSGILEEAYEGYSSDTKIIFSHSIKNALENKAADVEVKDESFSVYISGIDVYGAIETNSRSDVNIIATVNPKTHQVLLVTTPRDYYVEIPGISG